MSNLDVLMSIFDTWRQNITSGIKILSRYIKLWCRMSDFDIKHLCTHNWRTMPWLFLKEKTAASLKCETVHSLLPHPWRIIIFSMMKHIYACDVTSCFVPIIFFHTLSHKTSQMKMVRYQMCQRGLRNKCTFGRDSHKTLNFLGTSIYQMRFFEHWFYSMSKLPHLWLS